MALLLPLINKQIDGSRVPLLAIPVPHYIHLGGGDLPDPSPSPLSEIFARRAIHALFPVGDKTGTQPPSIFPARISESRPSRCHMPRRSHEQTRGFIYAFHSFRSAPRYVSQKTPRPFRLHPGNSMPRLHRPFRHKVQ